MLLGVFEDRFWRNFTPLTLTRPSFNLLIGTSTLLEKIIKSLGYSGRVYLFTRRYLGGVLSENFGDWPVNKPESVDDTILMVNGLLLPDREFAEKALKLEVGEGLIHGERIIAACISPRNLTSFLEGVESSEPRKLLNKAYEYAGAKTLRYLWDIINLNHEMIVFEWERPEGLAELDSTVKILGDQSMIALGEGASVEGYAVLDTRSGPIYIGGGTVVKPFSRLEGPLWIGRNCLIESSIVKGGTSIGDNSRVGGEVEASVIQGHSNKRHLGYLGHSYVGEWVNIGAGTNISNLKNTYGTQRVLIEGRRVDTGRVFLGCFIGDHAKTAIGVQIASAKLVGVSSHVYADAPQYIPSFTASTGDGLVEIFIESAIETAKRMMGRRGRTLTPAYEEMLREVHSLTEDDRMRFGVEKRWLGSRHGF
ncbi:Bifunctional protein GlmU [archaeon HR01]|nr:Bifunctional protein GlmU [archaeon HR01]